MNKLVRPPNPLAPEQQLSVARVMDQALAPFRLGEEMEDAYCGAWEARKLVEHDGDGKLAALQQATDQPARWALHCRAYELSDTLPPNDRIAAAYSAVIQSIKTEPTYKERKMLASVLLDGLGLKSDDGTAAYVEALAWALGDCPTRETEIYSSRKRWIPIPAIARAIRQVWLTGRSDYGRPIPISDFLDECGRHSSRLIQLGGRIMLLGRARQRLTEIVKATGGSYPAEDWSEA
jgi:hypothetical protein